MGFFTPLLQPPLPQLTSRPLHCTPETSVNCQQDPLDPQTPCDCHLHLLTAARPSLNPEDPTTLPGMLSLLPHPTDRQAAPRPPLPPPPEVPPPNLRLSDPRSPTTLLLVATAHPQVTLCHSVRISAPGWITVTTFSVFLDIIPSYQSSHRPDLSSSVASGIRGPLLPHALCAT